MRLDERAFPITRITEAATEIGLVEAQLPALFGIAALEAEASDARARGRSARTGTAPRLQAALGPDALAAGAALSLEDAIGLALE